MGDPDIKDTQDDAVAERAVEALAQDLALKLRSMRNREELTDYAVSLLRESDEEAGAEERMRVSIPETSAETSAGNPFNPIAFGIPLLVVGAVLSATGILIGPGLSVIAIAILMVVYGLLASLFGGRSRRKARSGEDRG